METKVECKEIGDLSFLRNITKHIIGFCKYCGKKYVNCHSNDLNLFFPLPQNGKCCPNGHEGYTEQFMGWGIIVNKFDNVKK